MWNEIQMNCQSRAVLWTMWKRISTERSALLCIAGPRKMPFRVSLARSVVFSDACSDGIRRIRQSLNSQKLAQNLPLLLTDSRDRQKFLQAPKAAFLYPKFDDSLCKHRANAGQSFQLLRG